MTESKKVSCEYCGDTGYGSTELAAESIPCIGCDGTGVMEIRKSEHSDWSSRCPTCEGKGFNDSWNYQREEHCTPDCIDCNATGGIPYLKPVE